MENIKTVYYGALIRFKFWMLNNKTKSIIIINAISFIMGIAVVKALKLCLI